MQNRRLIFSPKIEYKLVAESRGKRDKLREATASYLQFPVWWFTTSEFLYEIEKRVEWRWRELNPRVERKAKNILLI